MKKLFDRLTRKLEKNDSSSVFKGMFTLALGSSAGRIIGFASIPIVTRIYTPSDYGLLALYISIVGILAPCATMRYSTATPLPKKDAMAINLMAISLLLIALYSTALLILLSVFGRSFFALFDMIELAKWWWLVLLGIIGTAVYELFSAWSTRKKQYKVMAKTQLMQSLTGNAFKIILGLLGFKPIGLIFGQFLSQSGGAVSLIRSSLKDFKRLWPMINKKRLVFVAGYYKQFPIFRLPSQLLLKVSSNAPVLMMAALYDRGVTGQLSLALIAISMPTGIIAQAMAKAFYAEVAMIGRRDLVRVRKLAVDVQKKLFFLGVPLTLMVMLLAQPMFRIVFGVEWEVAGKYATILSPFVLLQFTSSPLIQVLNITGSQFLFLILNITRVLGLVVIFFVSKHFNIQSTQFIFVLSSYLFIYYLFQTVFVFRLMK